MADQYNLGFYAMVSEIVDQFTDEKRILDEFSERRFLKVKSTSLYLRILDLILLTQLNWYSILITNVKIINYLPSTMIIP